MYASFVLGLNTLLEGIGLVLLLGLLELLTSGFDARTWPVEKFSEYFPAMGNARIALWFGATTAAVYVVRSILAIVALRWVALIALREEVVIIERLTAAYLHAPLAAHLSRNSADFSRTLNVSVRNVFGPPFVTIVGAIGDVVSIVVVGVVLMTVDLRIALIVAFYFAVVAVTWDRAVRGRLTTSANEIHREQAAIFRHTAQSLGAVREIKVATTESHFTDAVTRVRQGLIGPNVVLSLSAVLPRYILEIGMVGAATAVAILAFATKDPQSATAALGVFVAAGFRAIAPVNKLLTALNSARKGAKSLDQVTEDLRAFEKFVHADHQSLGPQVVVGRIECVNVRFSYGGPPDVLKGVNVSIEPGSAVALVGRSGAGKTTLVDLLLGLRDPTGGEILVGGQLLSRVRRSWQRSIGYVPQEISLLDDTVRANVVFGLPDVDDARTWDALEGAQLASLIRELPRGLETRVGERGARLSGGQRQRLGIARALIRRPRVLILDEATSALDNETERRFIDTVDGLRGSVTTVTIAHRLSTVMRADRVYLLEDGEVAAVGTFDELVRDVPEFARSAELAGIRTSER